ncbi:hypothetical protein EJ07DRAFT_150696 [Lizonia empirigonia]|nr:hypothetical protein EJ07DRAFT_150696 [Lizonia empirigonia]
MKPCTSSMILLHINHKQTHISGTKPQDADIPQPSPQYHAKGERSVNNPQTGLIRSDTRVGELLLTARRVGTNKCCTGAGVCRDEKNTYGKSSDLWGDVQFWCKGDSGSVYGGNEVNRFCVVQSASWFVGLAQVGAATHTKHSRLNRSSTADRPKMPFPFMKLPPELRDEVYRYALVPSDGRVWIEKSGDNTALCYAYRGRDQVNSSQLRVCRTIYKEARIILYNEVEFRFEDWDSGKLILDFLLSRPEGSLRHFRKIGLLANTFLRRWPGYPEKHECVDKDDFYWDEVCAILAKKCDIRNLWLHVDLSAVSTHPRDKDGVPVPVSVDVIPTWAELLSQICGLHHLGVLVEGMAAAGQKVDPFTRKHILYSLVHMRNTMLDTCELPPLLNGSGLRIRQTPVGRSRYRFQIEMNIDHNCYTHFLPVKTVKVRPDIWCGACGRFMGYTDSSQWCRCTSGARKKRMYSLLVISTFTKQFLSMEIRFGRPRVGQQALGDRPMQEYLPSDVTMSDFAQAEAHLEEGFSLNAHENIDDWSLELGGGMA